ncbi:MAG: hypothetical protein AVDCRST_MAG68-4868, partial [uncultured Gemmatimonadetes bacterium]
VVSHDELQRRHARGVRLPDAAGGEHGLPHAPGAAGARRLPQHRGGVPLGRERGDAGDHGFAQPGVAGLRDGGGARAPDHRRVRRRV